jgi:hypothetical protein
MADLAKQCQENAKQRYQLEQQVQRRLLQNLRPDNNNYWYLHKPVTY